MAGKIVTVRFPSFEAKSIFDDLAISSRLSLNEAALWAVELSLILGRDQFSDFVVARQQCRVCLVSVDLTDLYLPARDESLSL